MPSEEKSPEPTLPPLGFDESKFTPLFDNFRKSYRALADDSVTALERASDVNKQISAFYERLLLLNMGTIGLSVSALIAFASKFPLVGFHKYVIVTLVSCAWAMLLRSTVLCRSVMMHCLVANGRLLKEWLANSREYNAGVLSSDISRFSLAITGTMTVGDRPVDAKTYFAETAEALKASFAVPTPTPVRDEIVQAGAEPESAQKGGLAIGWMQIGLIVLGIASVVLLVSM